MALAALSSKVPEVFDQSLWSSYCKSHYEVIGDSEDCGNFYVCCIEADPITMR